MYPHLPEFQWDSLEEHHYLSSPISLSIPLPAPASLLEVYTQTEGGLDNHSACTQVEGGLGCHPASTQTEGLGITFSLSFCRKPIKPGPNWSVSCSRRHRNWLQNASTSETNRP